MSTTHPSPAEDPRDAAPVPPARNTPAPEPDRFAAFLADGRRRRASLPAADGADRDAAPDPDAITRLPLAQRPVSRLLARRGGRAKSVRGFASNLAQSCRLLQQAGQDLLPPGAQRDLHSYPWHLVDVEHAAAYRRLVYARYSNVGTRNVMLSTVREVLRECRRAGLVSPERLEELLEQWPTKMAMRTSRGRRLRDEEIHALLTACLADAQRFHSARDAAVIAVFASTGVRCSDLVDFDLDDWDPEARSLFVRGPKNRNPYTVFLHPAAAEHLQAWLTLRGSWPGPLFTAVIGDRARRVTYPGVCALLRTRARQAGVRPFGSHDFRRTLATSLLRTHDVTLVGRLLGHKSVASTVVYDLADDEACRLAVQTLHLPDPETLQQDPGSSHQAEPTSSDAGPDGANGPSAQKDRPSAGEAA